MLRLSEMCLYPKVSKRTLQWYRGQYLAQHVDGCGHFLFRDPFVLLLLGGGPQPLPRQGALWRGKNKSDWSQVRNLVAASRPPGRST